MSKKVKRWQAWSMLSLLCLLSACVSTTPVQEKDADWGHYQERFIDAQGALHDAVNGDIRHSEGQGMAMLLAVAHADQKTFDRVWQWTKKHLQVRPHDRLLAWSWQSQQPHITDYNNASDGDLLVVWSLLRAFEQWHQASYRHEASLMLRDIRKHLIVSRYDRVLLLPGIYGFERKKGLMINPSYWVFPALQAFQAFEPEQTIWADLIRDGRMLIAESLLGVWHLPPDWLWVNDDVQALSSPVDGSKAKFGLDAVRIPLYLAWASYQQDEAVSSSRHFWRLFTGAGAWPDAVKLHQTNVHMSDQAYGVQSIAVLLQRLEQQKAPYPSIAWDTAEYYQATLALLSRLAEKERTQLQEKEDTP